MYASLKHWEIYLKGAHQFKVFTDCLSLLDLDTLFANCSALMTRKIQDLAEFRFQIEHIAGKANGTADFLSRYHYQNRANTVGTQTEKHETSTTVNTSLQRIEAYEDVNNGAERGRTGAREEQLRALREIKELRSVIITPGTSTHSQGPDIEKKSKRSTPCMETCTCNEGTRGKLSDLQVNTVEVQVKAPVCEKVTTTKTTGISKQLIKEAQENDDILREVSGWVIKGDKPRTLQAVGAPSELVTFWKTFKMLKLEDGILKRKWFDRNAEEERTLVIIPGMLREDVMKECHNSILVGHPGVTNSCNICLQHYYWPKLRDDFELFIAACTICGSVKQPQAYLRAPLDHMVYHQFNDAIVIDHIVPSKEDRTKRGNRYILTITDMWSGLCTALPCKSQTAEESARLIINHWCCIHGYPAQIISDQGSGFTSHYFTELLKLLETKLSLGQTYSCRSTAKAERTNKRVNGGLRAAMENEKMGNWDLYLPYITFALNSLKNRHTGFSANRLVYGREANTPRSILIENQAIADLRTIYIINRLPKLMKTPRS